MVWVLVFWALVKALKPLKNRDGLEFFSIQGFDDIGIVSFKVRRTIA
jgi:hypothetical protein